VSGFRIYRGALLALLISSLAAFSARGAAGQTVSAPKPPDILAGLKFRDLGPALAGGRVTAVAGIPGNSNVYYVGAAGGGVFKTTDGGITWKAIFPEGSSSIGAIAIAPSNPNYVWVGTGEANMRNDVIDGDGVYFSSNAGHSWRFMGLRDTQHIGSIIIDPANPEILFVGALGHAWGPNAERGVFRSTDGGKTWKKVLFVNDSTGAADLAMEPGNPRVLFAAMWQFRRYPWNDVNGGPGSGIYRSTDGGNTWRKLSKGLPPGPLGRIALAIAPSNPTHIYALVAAKHGMLWQSRNQGDSWTPLNDSHALDVRPPYFSNLVVSPDNEKKLFFCSFDLMESKDGGKTAHPIGRGVHSDHHAIWIDPDNPRRMIQGTDGGAYLSTDGGKHWRFLDGMPLEQFYQVAVGGGRPYTVCGGLQDNNGWCGLSSDLGRGRVMGESWQTVVGGDGQYVVPAPSDPHIFYADSQVGYIARVDMQNHLSRSIRPYLEGVTRMKPSALKYRFNWTSPIAVSRTDPNEVYLGANVVFRTTNGGKTWTPISGDLTRNDKSKQFLPGGPVGHSIARAETYDTILAITIAPTDPRVIWVGTDDGLVQLTRDGGKTWTNVMRNIPGAPEWARVYQVGVSPFNAGTAYVAFDAHEVNNRQVHVYRTEDYGKTWRKITGGLPADSPAYVVREDPNRRGLLVAGTDTGLFYSLDRGNHWRPLKSNFPTASVFDLKFVKRTHDLVVATHGRGILILDDIRPLEELTPHVEASQFHLFSSGPGVLLHTWKSIEGRYGYSAPNAPEGVIVDYYLKSAIHPTRAEKRERRSPVKIVVTDARGDAVANGYGPSAAGVNRFVWNMRYDGAVGLNLLPRQRDQFSGHRPGPRVVPGTYRVTVTVNGKTQSQQVAVVPDPHLHIDPAAFRAQARAALEARNELSALNEMLNRIAGMDKQLANFQSTIVAGSDERQKDKFAPVVAQGKALTRKLNRLRDAVFNPRVQRNAPEDVLHYLARLHRQLTRLAVEIAQPYGEAPNALVRQAMTRIFKKTGRRITVFNELVQTDVAAYNKAAEAAGAPKILSGGPVVVKPVK
jgi:photosystem II stability/assembly factor-like uncharacterized protein